MLDEGVVINSTVRVAPPKSRYFSCILRFLVYFCPFKKSTVRVLFIFLGTLLAGWLPAQAPDSLSFPASWSGDWVGQLEIFNGKGRVQTIAMEIEIHKLDTSTQGRYTFGLVYGSKAQDWRPYELVPVDPGRGLWRDDEKNSILLEAYQYGPKLLSWFVVEGSRVLSILEKTTANTLVFEIVSGPETPVSTTGNTMQGEEKIPEVRTYPVAVYQRAVLYKK